MNKTDLDLKIDISDIIDGDHYPICEVSAKEHTGIEVLNTEILKLIGATELYLEEGIPTRIRHMKLLDNAEKTLSNAIGGFEDGRNLELIAFDIKEALSSLGRIIGDITPEDILERIFQEFCIGK